MIELTIDTTNLYLTYSAVLESFSIGMPSPQINTVSILGRNGTIDYSTAINGKINYNDRTITAKLVVTGDAKEEKAIELINFLSGKKGKIIFSHLLGYFDGRCTTISLERNNAQRRMTINATFSCYPFRILTDGSEVL